MKKLSLLVLPLLLVITAIYLNSARGPDWLAGNQDPEYVYLLNSANLAGMKGVGHIDHPGTPVQVLGAVVMRVVHFVSSPGVDLSEDVLTRPEFYMRAVKTVFVALNTLMLLALGVVVFLVTRSLWVGVWLQAAPFFSIVLVQFGLTRMSPEPLLMFSALALVLLTVVLVKRDDVPLLLVLGLALVTGLGIAVKVTFVPLVILPLVVLPRLKNKLVYGAGVAVGFVIFTLPIIRMYPLFFKWIYGLLLHSGRYGTGASSIVSSDRYIGNFQKLVVGNPFFSFVLFISLAVLAAGVIVPKLRKVSFSNRYYKYLAGVFASQALGLLIVSKHSSNHYLLPVMCLSGLALYFIFSWLKHLFDFYKVNFNFLLVPTVLLLVTALILINPLYRVINKANRLASFKEKSLAIHEHVQRNYSDYAKIYYYRSSSPAFALKFGSDLSRSYFAESLEKHYENVYFYDQWRRKFCGFDYHRIIPFETIRAKYGDKIVFQGTRGVKIKVPGLKLKEAYHSRSSEGVFVIDTGMNNQRE